MGTHKNAPLTPKGREKMVRAVLDRQAGGRSPQSSTKGQRRSRERVAALRHPTEDIVRKVAREN